MRKRNIFRSDAFKLLCWAITPLLILACTTTKMAQNKSTFTTDTLIINRTDTVKVVQWRLRTDTIRERIYQRDSTSQRQEGNITVREIWHWETKESDRTRTVLDSLAAFIIKMKSERKANQRQETVEEQWKDGRRTMYTVFAIVGGIILIVIYWDIKRKT